MTVASSILVSSGEASGDRIAALVLRWLGNRVTASGMGGPLSTAAGLHCVVDHRGLSAMGITSVVGKLGRYHQAYRRLQQAALDRRVKVALLVNFTTFHQNLGRSLRAMGIPVIWCVAPQVWAWRSSRLRSLRQSVDHLCVLFPFEEPLWREHGYRVSFVGHPAQEAIPTRPQGAAPQRRRIAILPGSREQEIRACSHPMLAAAQELINRHGVEAEIVMSPGLAPRSARLLAQYATGAGIPIRPGDQVQGALPLLADYELALCVSGTATLECALAGTPPIILYRTDPLTWFLGARLVKLPWIGLPNILLEREAFPELLQRNCEQSAISNAAVQALGTLDRLRSDCRQLRAQFEHANGSTFGERVGTIVLRYASSP